jgi:hypothetical protein
MKHLLKQTFASSLVKNLDLDGVDVDVWGLIDLTI